MTGSRRRVAAAVAVALLAGALTTWLTRGGPVDEAGDLRAASGPTSTARAIPPANPRPPATSATSAPALPPARVPKGPSTTTAAEPAPPTELVVPRLGARMQVTPVGVDRRGDMAIPPNPRVAGWYRFGGTPDSVLGATVVAAHVDDSEYGTGPLARLQSVRRGDPVTVSAGGVLHRYRVTSVLRLAKGELDTDALFDRTRPARLHLVTCGGAFDRASGHYEDNIVVIATPVD